MPAGRPEGTPVIGLPPLQGGNTCERCFLGLKPQAASCRPFGAEHIPPCQRSEKGVSVLSHPDTSGCWQTACS